MRLVQSIFRFANILVIVLTLLAYLSAITRPSEMWFLQFIGMGYPFLLLSNLFFIVWWWKTGKRYYLFSLFTIILGFGHFRRFVGWSLIESSSDATAQVKILTYNIDNYSYILGEKNGNTHYLQFEKMLRKENPDIICFQESFITDIEYKNRLNRVPILQEYTYIYHPVQKGLVIFSKIPAFHQGKISLYEDAVETANGANYADFEISGKKFRLITTHLQSNSVRERTSTIINNPNLKDADTRHTAKNILKKVRDMSYFRELQADGIQAFIDGSPYPVIVAGDFNDTPQSYTYNTISNGLQDGFVEKGFGLGTTYAGNLPALRIDYILASPKFQFLYYRIPSVKYSDHYPVSAGILLK